MSETSTALAVREPAVITTSSVYHPQSLAEARALAVEMAASRMFSAKGKEQALAVMGAGAELGLSPLASLRMIYVADFGNGPQIAISADAMVAACLRRRDMCAYFRTVESTDTSCTVETQRVGDPPRRCTFTTEDAKRAKLGEVKDKTKDATATNWAKYPALMLRHRAASILAREVFPDILGGMYTEDELREAARDVTPPAVQPLPAARPAPVDAEVVERAAAEPLETDDQRAERAVVRLEAAQTEQERTEIVAEVNGWKLPKGAARDRVAEASKAAKARIARPVVPTPSAATDAIVSGEVFVREEIGSDG